MEQLTMKLETILEVVRVKQEVMERPVEYRTGMVRVLQYKSKQRRLKQSLLSQYQQTRQQRQEKKLTDYQQASFLGQ